MASLDELMQLAMSVYYNQDITKKKEKDRRHHGLITALRECPTQACYHVDRMGTSAENAQKADSLGDRPASTGTLPSPSAKVTTGGLSALVSRWKVGCHLLRIDGFWGLLSRIHLTSMLRSLR
jgi:hypothetical protein